MKVYTKIAIIYIVACSLYILCSDSIIYAISNDPEWLTEVQSYKGVAFVFLSGLLIYFLVKYYFSSHLKSQEELEATIQYYRLVFDKNPLPCYIVDANSSKFLRVNKAAEAMFGKTQEEFLKSSILDVVAGAKQEQVLLALSRINGFTDMVIDTVHQNGRVMHQQVFCQPIEHEGVKSIFVISLDISTTRDSQQVFMDKLLDSLEEERSKISGELHDGIKQYFGLIKGMLTSFLAKSEPSKYIEKALELAEMGAEESRRLSHAVAPGFGGMDLCDSLIHLAENLNMSTNVAITINCNVTSSPSSEVGINIYRIAQEALNNILVHSSAENASIKLMQENDDLVLEISDDGKGLEGDSYPKSMENIGINMMKTRATKLRGIFEIFSDENKGTLIRVRVPCCAVVY